MNGQTREILDRLPVKLLADYHRAWAKYQAACVSRSGPEACSSAYEAARAMEDKLQREIGRVGAQLRREKARAAKAKAA